MATAIIYIRVSTDEQALRGYSQRSQAERLLKYCTDHQIQVLQTIFEDYSAKTFKRPEWSKLMLALGHHKAMRPNLLLFTRWDRFSRNTADAYYMITLLQKWHITPQAIDQPLNMAIPENKVLLAMYIVTSEVENDRRSLNVKHGIYRAKQEGRWIGKAPIGFINCILPSGTKSIAPHEPEAFLVRKIFLRIAEYNLNIKSLYQQSIAEGLRCSLNTFRHIIQSPVYCGRVSIPPFEDKAGYEVQGVHEPIITQELFDLVKNILDGQKRHDYHHQPANELLPLRGFLYCPYCCHKLSGSGSLGNTKRYYYYHCIAPCRYRVRADKLNDLFFQTISSLKAPDEYIEIYKMVLQESFGELYQQRVVDQTYISTAIDKLVTRTTTAKELLMNGNIDSEDYLAIRQDCEQRINALGTELHSAYTFTMKKAENLDNTAMQLSALGHLYEHTDLTRKRQLIGLLLRENAVFESSDFCQLLKPSVQVIYGIANADLQLEFNPEILHNEGHLILPAQDEMKCLRVQLTEQQRGHLIDDTTCFQVVQFMKDFANLYPEVVKPGRSI